MRRMLKSKLVNLLFLGTLSFSTFASEHGVRGGGHVIEVNGRMELVDLVTSATCSWFSGKEMIKSNPSIEQVLNKIEKLDWYLALELKREIEYISWCMTGNLYSVSAVDDDSFVQQLAKGVQQAAFRYNDSAYIDQSKFNQLSSSSQAYLIFHETLHSYLPMGLEMRRFKLMSLVSTLRKVDLDQITSRQSLHLNLSKNDMDFPLNVEKLAPFKKSLNFILGSTEERSNLILNATHPEALIQSNINNALPYLATWDAAAIRNSSEIFKSTIRGILLEGNLANAKRILHEQTYQKINPAALGLNIYPDLTEEIQKEVLASTYFSSITQNALSFLRDINIAVINGRILGDPALQALSNECSSPTPLYLISLTPLGEGNKCALPDALQGIIDLMIVMTNSGELDVLNSQFVGNQDFIKAVEMRNAFSNLSVLNAPIKRELPLAMSVLKEIQQAMLKRMRTEALARTQDALIINEIFNQFKNK